MSRSILYIITLLSLCFSSVKAQDIDYSVTTTYHNELTQLATRLLKGKKGSVVAIQPSTGEVLCLATMSADGPNDALAIATAYPPGSTFKPAEALTLLTLGSILPTTSVACNKGGRWGNIKVGCHQHASPLQMVNALGYSCNTWFLSTFLSYMNNRRLFPTKEEAVTAWHDNIVSQGFGGPLGIDLSGERGGLVANLNYLKRRYPDGWDAKTIMWAAMGQGDLTATPLQLCNYAVTIANRGWFITPHVHRGTPERPLSSRYLTPRYTQVASEAYVPVIKGMRQAVLKGTLTGINTSRYTLCGKTGTAENAGRDHSAFIGFAPMNSPQIAVAVYIEHGGFGADMAAPIASLIIERYLTGQLSASSLAKAKRIEARSTLSNTKK